MADSLTPQLVTGAFTLAAALAGSALTTSYNGRRDRRQDLQATYFRNLDQRRTFILEFLLVYDELRRLAAQGRAAARADYTSDESFVGHLDDLRRRLGEARTNLELFCGPTTRSVVDEAEQLGRYVWMVLVGRRSASAELLTTHAASMTRHKDALFKAFRAELGEAS